MSQLTAQVIADFVRRARPSALVDENEKIAKFIEEQDALIEQIKVIVSGIQPDEVIVKTLKDLLSA